VGAIHLSAAFFRSHAGGALGGGADQLQPRRDRVPGKRYRRIHFVRTSLTQRARVQPTQACRVRIVFVTTKARRAALRRARRRACSLPSQKDSRRPPSPVVRLNWLRVLGPSAPLVSLAALCLHAGR
jgi:hypothetical protein